MTQQGDGREFTNDDVFGSHYTGLNKSWLQPRTMHVDTPLITPCSKWTHFSDTLPGSDFLTPPFAI